MAEGTVRGAFDLDTRPAVRGVRDYRQEAERADAATKSLGSSIDDAFGPSEVAHIQTVREEMKGLGTQSRETRIEVRDQWKGMRREIEREAAGISSSIAAVKQRMGALGRERATPHVDVSGITAAIAQVDLLESRLNSLSRQRATPRVAMGGGFGGAAARAASGAAGGGRAGVFANSGTGGSGFSVGPLSGRALALGAGLGLPAVSSLAGGAVGLGGSAGGALLGAGAGGLAGFGALAVGGGSAFSVAKPAQTALAATIKVQTKYTAAVRDFGRASTQAKNAKRELDQAYADNRGVQHATRQLSAFKREWKSLTAPGRRDYFGMIGDVTQIGRRVAPNLAANANTSMHAVRGAATNFAGFAAGNETQRFLGFETQTFARELPIAERSLENVTLGIEHLIRAATPFFHEANVWVEHWSAGWADSTSNIDEQHRKMEPLVQSWRTWWHLLGTTKTLLRDIFTAGQPSGDSLVMSLDHTFQHWDDWIKQHPASTRKWFADSADSVRGMADALRHVVHWLSQMADLLRPLLDRFSQLVGFASQLGLIGTPGALAAVMGGVRGFRGRGGGGAAGGMGGGMVPYFGAPAPAAAMGGGMAGAGGMAAGGAAYLAARGRMTWGSLGPIATPEAFAQRYGGVAGARYGMPMSQVGAVRGPWASRAASGMGRVGGALKGAGRAALPLALGFSALDFATFDGGFGQKLDAGLSSLTLGALPRPRTAAQTQDAASQYVQKFQASHVDALPATLGGGTTALGRINAEIGRLSGKKGLTSGQRLLGGGDASMFGLFSTGQGNRLTDEQMAENKKRIELLNDERAALIGTNHQMAVARNRRRNEQSKLDATRFGAELPGAMSVYRRRGLSVGDAMDKTVNQVEGKLKKIRGAGVETLGEASLAWARELAKHNPALKKQVDELNDAIEARFRRMGKRVQIVNGDILTGSKREWRDIRTAMSDPIEKARAQMTDDFTAIQQKAIGSLVSMGFNRGDAQSLVQGIEKGGKAGTTARQDTNLGPQGASGLRASDIARPGFTPTKKARGGVIGGRGLMDTVPIGGGGMAAPGEAWIANRHTLGDLSRATVAMYGLTAQQIIRGETRRHGYARGGMARGGPTGGGIGGANPAVSEIARAAMSQFPGLSVTSTTGGGHATNSLHYRGAAIDLAGGNMNAAAAFIGQQFGKTLAEGIHNPNLSVKGGHTVSPAFWGAKTWAEHANHIHIGAFGLGAKGAAGMIGGGMGGGGKQFPHVALHGLGRQQPGVPGALRQRGGDIFAAGLQRKLNKAIDKKNAAMGGGGGSLAGFSGGGSATANMRLGRKMMLAAGFGGDQWGALRTLWQGESGWSNTARNPSSGAFGIPQALPPGKMGPKAAAGDPAAQIAWGLNYIRGRYGSPAGALSAWQARSPHWYARGGRAAGGTLLVGDSLGVGTSPYLKRMLGDVTTDAVVGRSSASGVSAMAEKMRGGDFSSIFFDLGTNDASAKQLRASLNRARDLAHGIPITAATVRGPGAARKNSMLRDFASEGLISLVDWAGHSGGLVGGDGIHASGKGYKARAQMVAGALQQGSVMDWGGGFKNGGSMVTNGPTAFVAGEGHRRRERVTVSPDLTGRGGQHAGPRVVIEKGAVQVHIDGSGHSPKDIEALAEKVGTKVVRKIIDAIDRKGGVAVID